MFNIFEQPWGLLTVAAIVLIVTLILRTFLPDKKHWWQLLLPALIVAAAFGLDFLVETDLEKIKGVITTVVKAVKQEDPDAIGPLIADDYRDPRHRTKARLMNHCRRRLSQPLVDKIIKSILAVEISSPRATTIFTVRIVFDERSNVYQNFMRIMLVKVKLDLEKQSDDRWLINRTEILEINRQPANWRNINY